jgi:hypothetical protein
MTRRGRGRQRKRQLLVTFDITFSRDKTRSGRSTRFCVPRDYVSGKDIEYIERLISQQHSVHEDCVVVTSYQFLTVGGH